MAKDIEPKSSKDYSYLSGQKFPFDELGKDPRLQRVPPPPGNDRKPTIAEQKEKALEEQKADWRQAMLDKHSVPALPWAKTVGLGRTGDSVRLGSGEDKTSAPKGDLGTAGGKRTHKHDLSEPEPVIRSLTGRGKSVIDWGDSNDVTSPRVESKTKQTKEVRKQGPSRKAI